MSERKIFKRSLPNEILFQIFLELPAKCLSRLKCVSKEWCFLIENPEFVDSHRLHSYTRSGGVHLLGLRLNVRQVKNGPPVLFLTDPEGNSEEPTEIAVRQGFCCRQRDEISYVEGLVCFRDLICNLSTNESIRLPYEQWSDGCYLPDMRYMIGFDESSKLYKVLRFCTASLVTQVLTLGTNSWRDVFCIPIPDDSGPDALYPPTKIYASLSMDNKIFILISSPYFSAEHRKGAILTFEVGLEKFRLIGLPHALTANDFVLEVNGRFTMTDRQDVRTTWILQDYENEEWIKINIIFPDYFKVIKQETIIRRATPSGLRARLICLAPSAISVTPLGTMHTREILFKARKNHGTETAFYFYYNLATANIRQIPEHKLIGSVRQIPNGRRVMATRDPERVLVMLGGAESIMFFKHVETIFRLKGDPKNS